MPEPTGQGIASREACQGCGVEVRSGSEYCFNCGGKVSSASELANAGTSVSTGNGFRANGPGAIKNADERRPARRSRTQKSEPTQVIWRPADDAGYGFALLSLVAALAVIAFVCIAYYLK